MKTSGIFAGAFIFLIIAGLTTASARMSTEEVVRLILSESMHIGDPTKTEQLRRYSERSEVPIEEIGRILVKIAENPSEKEVTRRFSVEIIGDLGLKETLPVLKKISRSDTDSLIGAAIVAVVQIGDDGLSDFAWQVVKDRQQYTKHHRFLLYRAISSYLKPDVSRKNMKLRREVLEFFSDVIGTEPYPGNLMTLDEKLGDADEQYRTSYEREEVLEKVENSKAERHKKYASEQLERLRKLPKEKRTRVRIGKSTEK